MYEPDGFGWRSRLGLLLALALLLFCLCAPHLESWEACGVISQQSAPDWPELRLSLQKIDEGLSMTDEPLSLIDSSLAEREQQSNEREASLLQREQESSATEKRLQQREQGLNERERGLLRRESLYADMQVNLDDAQKRLKRGWLWIAGAALAGAAVGYLAAR